MSARKLPGWSKATTTVRFLHIGFLLHRRAPHIDRGHFLVAHGFLPAPLFNFFRPLAFAHLALAAFRAIFRRFAGVKFLILALADLRPI